MSTIYDSPLVSTSGSHTSNLFDMTLIPFSSRASKTADHISGSLTFNGLVAEPGNTVGGAIWAGVNSTFYNRILIEPATLDLGNMLSNQVRTIQVWNGFVETKTLESVNGVNDIGMALSGGPSTPYSFKGLQTLTYTLSVSTEGPANVDASYTWRVDGLGYSAYIVGKRTIVFAFPINFKQDLIESLEWKTDIFISDDGTEQRRALRTKARRGISYYLTLDGFDQQLFQNSLIGWQNRVFAVPVWTDKRVTSAAMTVGTKTIPVNPTDYSFIVGDSVILFKDAQNFEVGEILSLTTTIGVKNAIGNAWPKGTAVYPLIQGHLPESVDVTRYTDSVMDANVRFIASPAVTDPYIPTSTAPTIYDSLEVITIQPNWIDNIDTSHDYDFDTVDKQTGGISWFANVTYPRIVRAFVWLLSTRAELTAFRAFLGRRIGRQKTFWVPSWTRDFDIAANIAAADTSITVKDNGFRKLVGLNPAYDRIMIKMKTGAVFYRKITSVTLASDAINTQLSITALGTAYTVSQVKMICLLHRCRLATDKVELKFKSNNIAVVATSLTTVKL